MKQDLRVIRVVITVLMTVGIMQNVYAFEGTWSLGIGSSIPSLNRVKSDLDNGFQYGSETIKLKVFPASLDLNFGYAIKINPDLFIESSTGFSWIEGFGKQVDGLPDDPVFNDLYYDSDVWSFPINIIGSYRSNLKFKDNRVIFGAMYGMQLSMFSVYYYGIQGIPFFGETSQNEYLFDVSAGGSKFSIFTGLALNYNSHLRIGWNFARYETDEVELFEEKIKLDEMYPIEMSGLFIELRRTFF